MDTKQTVPTMQNRRRLRGIVVRAAMPKTITVRVERIFQHSRVRRVVRRSRKFLVDDAEGSAQVGDSVVIEEARPLSRHKRWRVIDITKRAVALEGNKEEESI